MKKILILSTLILITGCIGMRRNNINIENNKIKRINDINISIIEKFNKDLTPDFQYEKAGKKIKASLSDIEFHSNDKFKFNLDGKIIKFEHQNYEEEKNSGLFVDSPNINSYFVFNFTENSMPNEQSDVFFYQNNMSIDDLKAKLKDYYKNNSRIYNTHSEEERQKTLERIENLTQEDAKKYKARYRSKINKLDFFGQDKDIGLKYSNFGLLEQTIENGFFDGKKPDSNIKLSDLKIHKIHRGITYSFKDTEIKKIDLPDEKLEFTGKSVGNISKYENNKYKKSKNIIAKEAKLIYDNSDKSETLTASFEDWYDIEIKKKNDDSKLKLSNFKGKDKDFKYEGSETEFESNLDIHYAGDPKEKKPIESVASGYSIINWDKSKLLFEFGFGGKKQ